ncbi:hypothetical protein LSCM1_03825 [Leishmania martiniquensis]|uniref:AAA+ ATPase domain-containing protein n=1 Tax=Leishmania martiniquensis TaxID=1580590 RepID=A0A836GCJ1_9TRYP|nr:hypothetical protein LSCM1_03825 [Leishmania martiniquensis]
MRGVAMRRAGTTAVLYLFFPLPLSSLASGSRFLRTKVGANTNERLRAAERDESASTSARPPPSAMDLSYITAKMPDLLPGCQTEDAVWSAATFRSAWSTLHKAYASFLASDPARAAELLEKDWQGLALYNSYAETLHLMSLLAPSLRIAITEHPSFDYAEVEELFVHLGQDVEVRGSGGWVIQLPPPTVTELQFLLKHIGRFGADGRGCVANTAHRASVWRGRHGEALGVTLRVGRYVPGAARALLPLARRGSLLILSKAGMGKTTLLRDLAAGLAHDPRTPRVTVVDTSNEIGGDGPIPLPYLGRCRRIQVARREDQSRVMIEVIQNHTPDYLIVDEIATEEEAEAAWSISQRGVLMIGTCHGEHLEGLLQNRALNLLVGGAAHAFLSNEERRLRNKKKKTVLERPYSSPFSFVMELQARNRGHLYVDVNKAVDLALDEQPAQLDAAVGAAVELNALLPSRVERLLRSQDERKRRLKRASGLDGNDVEVGEDEDDTMSFSSASRDTVDRSGDTQLAGNGSGQQSSSGTVSSTCSALNNAGRHRRHSQDEKQRRRARKTDEQLYKELQGFF